MRMNKRIVHPGRMPDFCDTITLFNRYYDADKRSTTWEKTVLENCYFGVSRIQTVSGNTVSMADVYSAHIPKNSRYLSYEKWNGQDEYFTLNPKDLVFKGDISETLQDNDSGAKLVDKYKPNCFVIQSIKICITGGILDRYDLGGV